MGDAQTGNAGQNGHGGPGGHSGQGPAPPAIEAVDLTKVYKTGTQANDGISLTVRRGEVFGLLGPNGAGKSTFVQQVQGLM